MAQLAMYASPFLKNGPFKVQTGIAQKAFDPHSKSVKNSTESLNEEVAQK